MQNKEGGAEGHGKGYESGAPIIVAVYGFLLLMGILVWVVTTDSRSEDQSGDPPRDFTAGVIDAEGKDGLVVLKLFGDDAADLFTTNRPGFRELVAIAQLDIPTREISAGPWRDAVVQWARSGHLKSYLDHLKRLGPDQWEVLRKVPGCLPLLARGAKEAEAMLARHGARAWGLFLVVDFADDVQGIERVARALAIHGDRMLRVNESHGPALAMLFVPPPGDDKNLLPRLFGLAVDRLGVEEAGALFLGNYDDLRRLALEERRPSEDLVESFDLLAGQPEKVRAMASDSSMVVRLLLERRGREPIGAEILARCGPEAGDLLYEKAGYASRPDEKTAALAILARHGGSAIDLLRTFRDDDSWHRLLRRADLMDSDDEPLIVRLAGKLGHSSQRQDDIQRYLSMPREQIVEEYIPVTPAAQVLEWVPGYVAVHTAYNAARGYHIEPSEAAMAVFDGVTTVTFIGQLAGQAIKTVGKAGAKAAIRSVEVKAASELTAKMGPQAAKTVMTKLPGALPSLMRLLPERLSELEVTSVVRSASGLAKKVGVRTWGRLDRRIIMRGDRRVLIAPFNKKVVSRAGEQIKDMIRDKREELILKTFNELQERVVQGLQWKTAPGEVGVLAPCIMERVLPGLRIKDEEWPSERPDDQDVPVLAHDSRTDITSRLGKHPIFLGVGMVSITVCLSMAVPRVRRAVGRAFKFKPVTPGTPPSIQRPRSYRE